MSIEIPAAATQGLKVITGNGAAGWCGGEDVLTAVGGCEDLSESLSYVLPNQNRKYRAAVPDSRVSEMIHVIET